MSRGLPQIHRPNVDTAACERQFGTDPCDSWADADLSIVCMAGRVHGIPARVEPMRTDRANLDSLSLGIMGRALHRRLSRRAGPLLQRSAPQH